MSENEDTEPTLKELVTKTLENNGVLGKIQAQLRASIFLTLEEEFKNKNIPMISKRTQQILSSPVGKLGALIIQDFFQCLGLEFSLAVFGPESNFSFGDSLDNEATQSVFKELEFDCAFKGEENCPFLLQLINNVQSIKSKRDENDKEKFIMNAFDKAYSELNDASISDKSVGVEVNESNNSADYEKNSLETSNETDESESSTLNSGKVNQSDLVDSKESYSDKSSEEQIDRSEDDRKSISEKSKSNSLHDKKNEDLGKPPLERLIGSVDNPSIPGKNGSNPGNRTLQSSNNEYFSETSLLKDKKFADTGQSNDNDHSDIKTSSGESSEVIEEFDEDISDLLNSTSLDVSQNTQDVSASQLSKQPDFQESL